MASKLQVARKGYVTGTSGGPFLIKMGNGLGLAGVTGGWMTGGHSPDTSYSSYFGDDVKRVFDAAVAGKQPDSRPGSALPPGETWRDYARGIASGYFTGGGDNSRDRMDMLVWWKDGEVSLYRGANPEKGYFDKEIQVQAPNDIWHDYALEITAGGTLPETANRMWSSAGRTARCRCTRPWTRTDSTAKFRSSHPMTTGRTTRNR
ncbi:hypothetical protein OG389_29645 [Streptomyces sp. NBC_00435]|uniref:hypothetical protein n=1 Tax=Streptomyces sp. NBC_00435 TaxID=2903649 RepID=UPI002E229C74